MSTDDLKQHVNSSHDFYALLDVSPSAQDSELRRAYRKTALKYHPDKVGASDTAALEKFHLLQIAYDVLSDSAIRELYDNARRAREQVKEREAQLSARRTDLKNDLERREREGVKRKRGEVEDAELEWQRELARIREDTKRRKTELEERRRREMEILQREEMEEESAGTGHADGAASAPAGVTEMDRSIKFRFPTDSTTSSGSEVNKEYIVDRFSQFGAVEDVIIRSKSQKDSKKHRKRYNTVLLVFESVVGAHGAVTDFSKVAKDRPADFRVFEGVDWAAGRQPDFLPGAPKRPETSVLRPTRAAEEMARNESTAEKELIDSEDGGDTDMKEAKAPPKFGSFKGGQTGAKGGTGGASLDEITMIRLKNAEKRRLEQKIRKEEAAVAADDAKTEAATNGTAG